MNESTTITPPVTIPAPEIEASGGLYKLRFDLHTGGTVSVTASRVKESSRGTVTTAELHVKASHFQHPYFEDVFSLNMLSKATKASVSKDLGYSASAHLQVDGWRQVIGRTCIEILKEHRKGEPMVELVDYEGPSGYRYRLAPMLPEEQPSLLFGYGDSGKSLLALLAGYLVATGRSEMGLTPEMGNVAYLDYETDKDTVWDRLKMLAAGFGEDIPPFYHYLPMRSPLADDIERVNRCLSEHNISMVIIDSAAPAVGEPEEAGEVSRYFMALRTLKVTSLSVAHMAKTAKESDPFGSVFFTNMARATFRARAEKNGDTTSVHIRNYKRNDGPRLADKAFDFTFSESSLTVKSGDVHGFDHLQATTDKDRVYRLLQGGGAMAAKDIAEELGVSSDTVRTNLQRLGDRVVKLGDKRNATWGIRASRDHA